MNYSSDSEANLIFDEKSSNPGKRIEVQTPLLPRFGWLDRQHFLRVLIRAKRSLDLAETTAFLD